MWNSTKHTSSGSVYLKNIEFPQSQLRTPEKINRSQKQKRVYKLNIENEHVRKELLKRFSYA